MPKSKLTFIIFLAIQSYINCQWIQSNIINKGFVSEIAAKDSIIFLGGRNLSDSLVSYFYSKDYGNSWKECYNNKASHPNTIVISDKYIFAGEGFEGGNIYRTSDWGINWEECFNKGLGVTSMAYYGNNIYVGTTSDISFQGIWKSSDSCNNWTKIWNGVNGSLSISSLIAIDSSIIAGTNASGVYGSSNNGESWNSLNDGLPSNSYINSMTLFNNKIFAGVNSEGGGMFYTTDFGLSWQQLNDGLENPYSKAFASSENLLFLITNSKVFVLLQNENKWKEITENLPDLYLMSIAICDDNLFVGTMENGLWQRSLSSITGIEKEITEPEVFSLLQNYPNPFNPTTTIKYNIPKQSHVTLKIYDVLGREVTTLINEIKSPGSYCVEFNAGKLSSGIYIYTLQTNGNILSNKMLLMK